MFGYSWIKDQLWARYSHREEELFQHLLQSPLWLQNVFSFLFNPPLAIFLLHSSLVLPAACRGVWSQGFIKGAGAVFASMCKSKKQVNMEAPLERKQLSAKKPGDLKEGTEQKERGRCLASKGQEGGWQAAGWESRNRFHFTCKICDLWEEENVILQ